MSDTADRQRLIELLNSLASRTYWAVLRDHANEKDKHTADAAQWHNAARRAEDEGSSELSKTYRGFAKTQASHAEIFRQCACTMVEAYGECNQLVAMLSPSLLGKLPVIDWGNLGGIDATQMARDVKTVLGELLAQGVEQSSADDEGETLGRMMAMMDNTQARIVAIADKPDLTVEEKLRTISVLDARFYGKYSGELATLLGVSEGAIRRSSWWRIERKDALADLGEQRK